MAHRVDAAHSRDDDASSHAFGSPCTKRAKFAATRPPLWSQIRTTEALDASTAGQFSPLPIGQLFRISMYSGTCSGLPSGLRPNVVTSPATAGCRGSRPGRTGPLLQTGHPNGRTPFPLPLAADPRCGWCHAPSRPSGRRSVDFDLVRQHVAGPSFETKNLALLTFASTIRSRNSWWLPTNNPPAWAKPSTISGAGITGKPGM